jgi:pimeloyl-ACP methyl ester carboxylesterase
MPTVSLPGSLEMFYEDNDYTDPWRPPDAVVMHHGQAKSHKLWYGWVPELARQYRTLRIDARGYGNSSVPAPGYDWSLEGFADDIRNFLDAMGLDKVHLVGETVGGTISMRFAHMYPDRLKSLTVCSSPFKFVGASSYVENRDLVAAQGVEPWVRQEMDRRAPPGDNDNGYREWYAQLMIPTAQHVVVETLTYLSTVDLTAILPEITTPTLVLISEGEYNREPGRADGIVSLIPGARLEVIKGTSGFVQHTDPDKCVDVWRKFMGSLS